jgi:phosphoribosyl-AMP cyclohydrolase
MSPSKGSESAIEESRRFTPRFDASGLIPCIAIEAVSGDVLMMAWMNEEALRLSFASGFMHYWSRSRQTIWKKGETSGALQKIVELRVDCDQDTLLARVEMLNRAGTCHTGRTNCFYRTVPLGRGAIERPLEMDMTNAG